MAFILFYIGFYSILVVLLLVRVCCCCRPYELFVGIVTPLLLVVAAYVVAVVSNLNSDSNSNRKILAE